MKSLIESALIALRGPRFPPHEALARADELNLKQPGLYAVYGDEGAWIALGLGTPPNERPLYVGKAQDNLAARDLKQHFASGATGRSTLRRTLASLLRHKLDLVPRARGTNPLDRTARASLFALEPDGDLRLTQWMRDNLELAFWPMSSINSSELNIVEGEVIRELEPPLCLNKWSDAKWRPQIKRARSEMAEVLRDAASQQVRRADSPNPLSRRRTIRDRPDPELISAFLQKRLAVLERDVITAVEAAQWLETAGLLTNSQHRPGLPLRKLLRAGRIRGQRQEPNGRWYIDLVAQNRSDEEVRRDR